MSKQQQLSDAFLAKVREAYQESHPIFVELLQEQRQLKTFIAMMKAAAEVNADGEDIGGMLDVFARMLAYFDRTAGVLAIHDGLAMMVNAVTCEYEEGENAL